MCWERQLKYSVCAVYLIKCMRCARIAQRFVCCSCLLHLVQGGKAHHQVVYHTFLFFPLEGSSMPSERQRDFIFRV